MGIQRVGPVLIVCLAACNPAPEGPATPAPPAGPTVADAPAAPAAAGPKDVAATAEQTTPLKVGTRVPDLSFQDQAGKTVELGARLAEGPAVLIYYRGGWCPYCNAHLGKLKELEEPLGALGYRVLAVSPDRPEKLRESMEEIEPGYTLLSDASMAGARALGIAFRVGDGYNTKLRMFGIDIEDASGQKHHLLPVPSVFLLGKDGTINYVHSDPNYKERLDNDKLLAAAKQHAK